jgi:Gas vesicle synthesis protein GvpL/GvpF
MADGTYVFCVVAYDRRPRLSRKMRGLPGMGPVRLLDVDRGLGLAVADAPLTRYGEAAINRQLANLEWVSRAAVAHEAVVESFTGATAVLPMKLFTIFTSDARALAHVRGERKRVDTLVRRVARHDEWSVRLRLDRSRPERATARASRSDGTRTGVAYLARKKARRDATLELAERARETVARVYDRFATYARQARRRAAGELPMADGPLLLDAAFLVPRSRTAAFRALAAREARALARQGYGLTLNGPWPPYSFVQD